MNHDSDLHIRTGLKGFIVLDHITRITDSTITGEKHFVNLPAFMGIEALAQLGAYHVRFLTHFERHAFLLKIRECSVRLDQPLNGFFELRGRLLRHSTDAFSYALSGSRMDENSPSAAGPTTLCGEFLFATAAYDDRFQEEMLQRHYRKAFSCLYHASEAN